MTETTEPAAIAGLGTAAQAALRALNNAHARETSHLAPADWAHLVREARVALALGEAGFVIAVDAAADYDSPNFLWFRARYPRFLYVDRIVVSAAARGQGIARRLYDAVFEAARDAGLERVVCEVNRVPPNPGSDAFHAALGFAEVGRAELAGGAKTVRYLERLL
ncbi:GNAT family N-acetyltransferase [Paralimibaculum aggregatum]|uniref:GNAT family N-acetyltransferase n=1 Tax=Paralimibaculum aggregatum TaxID=3036245 RepID=A0ABQ6LMK6_9RHOB|nr:GNAT family N-acetyltransferase [Limibaculum sp. NKW23]GMG84436.1 GNAT family N-acetyltransferase [Limibaculum sp. NKW23]